MCWDTAGCVKSSAAAASLKEPRTATSRNVVSSLRSSITDHYAIGQQLIIGHDRGGRRTMLSMNHSRIRFATAPDAAALDRLAQLDSAAVPAGPQLVADRGRPPDRRRSRPVMAAAIADPFTHSADAVELLRRRARQLGAGPRVAAAKVPPRPLSDPWVVTTLASSTPAHRLRRRSAMRGRHQPPLRQPRLRGEHARAGRRVGGGRGVRARSTASVHRGTGAKSRISTEAYEQARDAVAALRRRARDGTAVLRPQHDRGDQRPRPRAAAGHARALHPGRAPREHAPVARATTCGCCPSPRSPEQLLDDAERALRAAGIDLLAVTGASNVTGEVWPLARARRARPRARRAAVRRRRAARPAPRDRHGRDRHRPPRALRPQALRAVRRGRARQPHAAHRRPAAHGRRRDQARDRRRRDLGRRARALRGRLAERRSAPSRSPPPATALDMERSRRASARSPPACTPAWRRSTACTTLALWPGAPRPRRRRHLQPRRLHATHELRATAQRRVRDRRAPRLLLRAPAAHPPARRLGRRGARGCTPSSRPAATPSCPARSGRASGSGRRLRTWTTLRRAALIACQTR